MVAITHALPFITIVKHFPNTDGSVPVLLEVLWNRGGIVHGMPEVGVEPENLGRCRSSTRQNRRSGGPAEGILGVGAVEQKASSSKPVQIRGDQLRHPRSYWELFLLNA